MLDHWRETGTVLGKGTEELERYSLFEKGSFGPGELGVKPAPKASYDAH